jgi:Predicted sugar phosphate isomerase
VIGIMASGRTPYTIGALEESKDKGALIIALTCNPKAKLNFDYHIAINVGPEVITGSTRMKAGTAQKLVLNMISTILMTKMGKTYHNLMVDVTPKNEKTCGEIHKHNSENNRSDQRKGRRVLYKKR